MSKMSELAVNEHYLSLPRKDGDEIEFLGDDIQHITLYPERIILELNDKSTVILTREQMVACLHDMHFFGRKARKHYHIEKLSMINPEV